MIRGNRDIARLGGVNVRGVQSPKPSFRGLILGQGSLGFYHPMTETSGTDMLDISGNGFDGSYSGPTLGGATVLGQPAPTFDGSDDTAPLDHTGLDTVFDDDVGTIGVAFQLSAAQAGDANPYTLIRLGADSNNFFGLGKINANVLSARHRLGGTTGPSPAYTILAADNDKLQYAVFTYNITANRTALYCQDSTDTNTASAGTWAGSLASGHTQISGVGAGQLWPNIACQAFYAPFEYSAAQAAQIIAAFRALEPNAS